MISVRLYSTKACIRDQSKFLTWGREGARRILGGSYGFQVKRRLHQSSPTEYKGGRGTIQIECHQLPKKGPHKKITEPYGGIVTRQKSCNLPPTPPPMQLFLIHGLVLERGSFVILFDRSFTFPCG